MSLTEADIQSLLATGIETVIAAVLDEDDLDENEAASRIARRMVMRGVEAKPAATGRVNIHAVAAGLFTVDAGLVAACNAIDPAITLATLADKVAVEKGQMVATVKIIPFAVAADLVEQACETLSRAEVLTVRPFVGRRVALIQTELLGVKESVLAKTARITQARLDRSGSTIVCDRRAPHEPQALAGQLTEVLREADMAILFGASAMCDFDDVLPAAIRAAGGSVIRAACRSIRAICWFSARYGARRSSARRAAPAARRRTASTGCSTASLPGWRSAQPTSPPWGVGGLLMEIPTRPLPRESTRADARLDVHVVLCSPPASSRMGGPNKLMALFDGTPLVRRVATQALAFEAASVTVVTGHQADRVGGRCPASTCGWCTIRILLPACRHR